MPGMLCDGCLTANLSSLANSKGGFDVLGIAILDGCISVRINE